MESLRNAEADYYYAGSNDVIDREDAIEIVKAGGNADLLIDRAKSKSGERIPYDGKWK